MGFNEVAAAGQDFSESTEVFGESFNYAVAAANMPWSGTNYGYTTASGATNYFSTPDGTGANALRSSFTITLSLTPTTWTPASFMYLFSYGLESGSLCCSAYLLSDGKVYFNSSKNGTAYATTMESSALGFSAGTVGYIRITRSTAGTGKIYKSTDGLTWTDVTAVLSSVSGTLYNTSGDFILSGYAATSAYSVAGNTNWMTLHAGYDSVDGSLALYFNPDEYLSGTSYTSSTGEVWTLSGGAIIVSRVELVGVFNQVEVEYQFDEFSTRKQTALACVTSKTQWTTASITPANRGVLTYGSANYVIEKIDGADTAAECAYTLTLKRLT